MTIANYALIKLLKCAGLLALATNLALASDESANPAMGPAEKYYRDTSLAGPVHLMRNIPHNDGTLRVYVLEGEIEEFINQKAAIGVADGVIVSTNITFNLKAPYPLVQAALMKTLDTSISNQLISSFEAEIYRRLQGLAAEKKAEKTLSVYLDVANEHFAVELPTGSPRHYCFIATDDQKGGTATTPNFIEFNRPERIAKQVSGCLTKMSDKARSVVIPLIGAASNGIRSTGERTCRMRNAFIGVVTGLQEFILSSPSPLAASKAHASPTIEIGIVVYRKDVQGLGDALSGAFANSAQGILDKAIADISEGKATTAELISDCRLEAIKSGLN